jgi:agmatinase
MRVRRSPHLYVEREEAGAVHVRERAAGNRAVLNRRATEWLMRLDEPSDVPEHPQLRRLLALGFLVEDGQHPRHVADKRFSRVAPAMFGRPFWRPEEPADFVFLGVPIDGGNRTAPGARNGPDGLRRASALYAAPTLAPTGGVGPGWIDYDSGDHRLQGARIADAGELFRRYGSGAEEDTERLADAVREIASSAACPVLIGGDHSITFGALRGLVRRPTGVLHLDAHSDAAPYEPGVPHDYGNVMSRVLSELDVRTVLQVGVRGFGQVPLSETPRRIGLPPAWLRSQSIQALLALADPSLDWYVSIDIDVVDPAFAPGTATPVPGGLTVAEVKAVLRGFAAARHIVGCDLAEVNPTFDQNGITAILGCELLLTLLGAIWEGRA